jgi:hypothetical protein
MVSVNFVLSHGNNCPSDHSSYTIRPNGVVFDIGDDNSLLFIGSKFCEDLNS